MDQSRGDIMYQIMNGILNKNNKKVFTIGQSYYPSFHYAKYPVPPDGDRIAEMKKDLKMMAEMGFNHVRIAALGLVELSDSGVVKIDTPFVDAMIEEADINKLSISVRLQGYSVNLRNFKDVAMVDSEGNIQDMTRWSDFIQTTMQHKGLLEDNVVYAKALAEHYDKFENVVGFQIYNEPHYPTSGAFFDYHEETIKAYRIWLVKNNYMTEEQVKDYVPPRSRKEQSEQMWVLWRMFSRDSLTHFLDNGSMGAKLGSSLPTYTCFVMQQATKDANVYCGGDFFANAKSMDIVGYTTYIRATGVEYHPFCLGADMVQCAAELEGKEGWCIELDSRTYIPLDIFNRNTYASIGAGLKGILYYQWRGDYPAEGVPYPNSCGLLNYDGTKTKNYDNAAKAVSFINKMSHYIVNARRRHEGVGFLHSDYAVFLCDARENDRERFGNVKNSYMGLHNACYKELREAGYNVSITDAEHLIDNPLGIKVLFVPNIEYLSQEEKEAIERFIEKGGKVFSGAYKISDNHTPILAYFPYPFPELSYEQNIYNVQYTAYDALTMYDIYPKVVSVTPEVKTQVLEGDGYTLIVLTNTSMVRKRVETRILCNMSLESATLHTMEGEFDVQILNGELKINSISDGGIIVCIHKEVD